MCQTVWQWLIPLIDRLQQGMGGDDVEANLRVRRRRNVKNAG